MVIIQEFPGDSGVRSDATEPLYENLWPLSASAAAALLTAVVLWFDLPALLVLGWLALVMLSHGAGFALWRARHRSPHLRASALLLRGSTLDALAIAMAWGLLAIGVIAGAGNASQLVICTVALAIMAGAPVFGLEAAVWPIAVPLALVSW